MWHQNHQFCKLLRNVYLLNFHFFFLSLSKVYFLFKFSGSDQTIPSPVHSNLRSQFSIYCDCGVPMVTLLVMSEGAW